MLNRDDAACVPDTTASEAIQQQEREKLETSGKHQFVELGNPLLVQPHAARLVINTVNETYIYIFVKFILY